MAEIEGDLESLDVMLSELEGSIAGASTVSAAFKSEMEDVQVTMRSATKDATGLSRSLGTSLKQAFNGLIFDGAKLSDVLKKMGSSIASSVLSSAVEPVTKSIGSMVANGLSSMLSFEKGGAFSSGRVTAFARGGVVDRPTNFPMRGGMGLMGEAGPEAIMPLARGPDGSLGVRAESGAKNVHVTMNISTPDVAGFRKSSSQVAAHVQRAIGRGSRNL